MGQKISKQIVPKLSNAMKSYESEVAKEAINDIAKRQAIAKAKGQKYIDPSAQDGFKRDTWGNQSVPQDMNQKHFLTEQQGVHEEMPKDLIDFLNEMGPLERTLSKEMTSEKVYDSLLDEDEQKRQRQQEARQRKRRRMPIVENLQAEGGDEMNGMTVERTTNFSQVIKETEEQTLRLSDEELFDLVHQLQENKTTIDAYLSQKFQNDLLKNEKHQNDNRTLLEQIQRHNGIPILMLDTDKSLIGAPKQNVEKLKMENVRMAPSIVQLCLAKKTTQVEQQKRNQLNEAIVVKK